MITLETELAHIRGLNDTFLKKLSKLGIVTVQNLLWHFPTRYEDFSRIVPIAELKPGTTATIRGVVKKIESRKSWKRRLQLVEAIIADDSGGIKAVWFNQTYIARVLQVGMEANFSGKVTSGKQGMYLASPSYEPVRSYKEMRHTAGLIPIYPETKGLTSRGLRYLMKPVLEVLPKIPDFLPQEILRKHNLPELNSALKHIHFPHTLTEAEQARRRFAFEDLFLIQLYTAKLRYALSQNKAPLIPISEDKIQAILKTLPFALTPSQQQSLDEILDDLTHEKPMNRLLQGDVGSGKTIVIAIAALLVALQKKQVVFMAPTEILARQHVASFENFFKDFLEKNNLRIGLLISGIKAQEKKKIYADIKNNELDIIIGTHAVLQKELRFPELALVIVDEQHRFGVEQRAQLIRDPKNTDASASNPRESAILPHFLSMTATPIPRTLSLTLFGDLDLSLINELPRGRIPIITKVVAPQNRSKAYAFVRERIIQGQQMFVICPRIEASANDSKPQTTKLWDDAKTVTEEYEKLAKTVFPEFKIGMVHGKMKSADKENVMRDFKEKKIDILVSTSVIEVGVDIPNATVMMIEGAEYFGLAQLHQFRGRVGRGEHQSYCLLFTTPESASARNRLKALTEAKNGFELAELDLTLRGPGEFLGDKQTGLPDIAMHALQNVELLKQAREDAISLLNTDPELKSLPELQLKLEQFKKKIHLE